MRQGLSRCLGIMGERRVVWLKALWGRIRERQREVRKPCCLMIMKGGDKAPLSKEYLRAN